MSVLCRCLPLTAGFFCCLALALPADEPSQATEAERIALLIKQLGSDKFQEREEATRALDAIGIPALAALRTAEKSEDAEVRRRAGDVIAAIEKRAKSFIAFAQNVLQAIELIHEHFVLELDPGELTATAVRSLYQQVNQDLPADLARRLAQVKDQTAKERYGLLFDARVRLGKRPDLPEHEDCHHAIRGLVQRLDPHSDYLEAQQFARERLDFQAGVGIKLRADPATGRVKVLTPLKDGPAYQAGLRAGDAILKITLNDDATGRPLPQPLVLAAKGLTLEVARQKLLGQAGSKVELTVQRAGEPKPLTLVVVRGRVTEETVQGSRRQADDRWSYWLDEDKRLAYLRVTMFARETLHDVRTVLDGLERDGIKGLVLDLRFNPGGLLNQAVDIADLFIDDGLIVDVRQRKQNNPYRSDDDGGFLKFPLACLINGETRSGAEIMAACLQDHSRAVLVGERTAGKGSVQNILDLKDTGRQLKLTTALFHRPDGRKLDRLQVPGRDPDEWGATPNAGYRVLLPDKEQQVLLEHLECQGAIAPRGARLPESGYTDRQLQAAVEYLKSTLGER